MTNLNFALPVAVEKIAIHFFVRPGSEVSMVYIAISITKQIIFVKRACLLPNFFESIKSSLRVYSQEF